MSCASVNHIQTYLGGFTYQYNCLKTLIGTAAFKHKIWFMNCKNSPVQGQSSNTAILVLFIIIMIKNKVKTLLKLYLGNTSV